MKCLTFTESALLRKTVLVSEDGAHIGYQRKSPGGWKSEFALGAYLSADELRQVLVEFSKYAPSLDTDKKPA